MNAKPLFSLWFKTLLILLGLMGVKVEAQSVPGPPSWGANYQLVWSQDFTTMSTLSVSANGPCGAGGTTWMATKPGGGNWFDFIPPSGNLDPFGIGSGYLDLRVQDNGDPNNGFSGYTGGILSSVDNNGNGFSQQYGYFECSMWCPGSPNTWPAFWLLNTSCLTDPGLPYTAEIDVTESYGNWGTGPNQSPPGQPDWDAYTWHQWGQNGNPTTSEGSYSEQPGMTTGYHTYGVDIEPTTTTWYFDRTAVWSAPTLAQAQTPMFLMVNLALGGGNYNNATNTGYNWDLTPSPTDLKVQYIAVYASPNSPNYTGGGGGGSPGTKSYAVQFGPFGTAEYTGSLFNGATTVYAFNSSNGSVFDLGSGPGSDAPAVTFNSGVLGTYDLGTETNGSTDISYLNSAYFYGGGGSNTPVTFTVSGVSAGDTVDFKFIQANQVPGTAVSIKPAGGSATTPVDINSDTAWTDAGSFSGATSYQISVTGTSPYGWNAEIAGALITVTNSSGSAPSITSSTTATVTVGSAFNYTITASNSPTSFNATGLPAGLSVNTSTGVISGTPTAAGTSSVALSASNASGTGTTTLTLTVNSSQGAGTKSYAVQFGPFGTAEYTGSLFNGATTVYAFNSSNGSVFDLGSGPGSDAPAVTFNSGVLGTYDLGTETNGSTDISYLNSAYFYGGGGSNTPVTFTVSGVSAGDTVDFKFIQANQVPGTAVSIKPAGGSATTPVDINSDTAWTDAGSFSGATSYQISVTGTSPYGWNAEIAGALITVTSGGGGGNLISNGTYEITLQQNGLAMAGAGTTNGSQVQQQTYSSAATQQWTLNNLGNNVVELTMSGTNEALEVPDSSTTAGAPLDVSSYTGGTNQQWTIVSSGTTGYYEIVNVNSGQIVNDTSGSNNSGNTLCQWTAGNATNEIWAFTATSGGGGGPGSKSYAVQFGPSGTPEYTGVLFNGATPIYAFNSSNGSVFDLGSGPGPDAPVSTFNAGMLGNYNLGTQTNGSSDISYLNSAYFYGGGGDSAPVTFTVSGVSAGDTVDFKFIQANQVPGTAVSITPAGGSATAPVDINSDTAWTDAGSFSGATSYQISVTGTSVYGWNAEIAGVLITVTPAP